MTRPDNGRFSSHVVATAALIAALFATWMPLASPTFAQRPWAEMDYGPFLSASITLPGSDGKHPRAITLKGVVVQVGNRVLGRSPATVCFDTDLLCYSAGWTHGWLKLMGTPFDGAHSPPRSSRPALDGIPIFVTHPTPGWADPRSAKWNDPRSEPYGPLPTAWGRYDGLHVNGDRVVFAYTLGEKTRVLDAPGYASHQRKYAVTRTLHVEPSDKPLSVLVHQLARGSQAITSRGGDIVSFGPTAVGLSRAESAEAKLRVQSLTRLVLDLPPSTSPRVVRLTYMRKTDASTDAWTALLDKPINDPQRLTKNDPGRWQEVITVKGVRGQPGREPALAVDSITLPTVNPGNAWMRPTAFDFFKDGRAAVATWSGDVWIVSGIDDTLAKLKWRRFATGLYQPLGLTIVDDVVYVLGRDQITRLHDTNNDGEADHYENFNNGCKVTPNFHEFACDLVRDKDGNFYYAKGAPLLGGMAWDPKSSHSGSILRVSKDGKTIERYATGLRACNGLSMSPPLADGKQWLTAADNEGLWVPTTNVHVVERGEFLGAVGMSHRATRPTTYDRPLFWLPRELDNSAASQVWVTSDKWGPLKGAMLHISYGRARLLNVVSEQVDGVTQGGAVRMRMSFDTGVMRGRFHPTDGQLYVAGLKGWQTTGLRDGGLYRVRYTGKPMYTIEAVKVTPTGMTLRFTDPLDRGSAGDPENWFAQAWNYRWRNAYGSDKYSAKNPRVKGRDDLDVESVAVSADGRTVALTIPDLRPAMQVAIQCSVKAADGYQVERELYYTIHRMPK